jgi:hypothetical protein
MKTQPLKGLGGSIRATVSLYLSVVPFVVVCVYLNAWMPVLHLDHSLRALRVTENLKTLMFARVATGRRLFQGSHKGHPHSITP